MSIVGGLDIHRKQITFDYLSGFPETTWAAGSRVHERSGAAPAGW